MKVQELINQLNKYPADMEVFMSERQTGFTYGLVNSSMMREIPFTEDENPSKEELSEAPRNRVVVLSED